MKPVPFCGALMLLYTCTALCDVQDLAPHQEAANGIDSCLTLADQQITFLSERLRELKTQRQRLSTLEDALSKVTLQKSKLEAELLNSSEKDSANADLEYALQDAQRTSNAYREETERLRQDVIRLSQSANRAASNQERLTAIEKKHAEALRQLASERKASEALKIARASSDAKVESGSKELAALREQLRLAEESAKQVVPLREQIKTNNQHLAEAEKARLRQVEQTAALTKQLEQAKILQQGKQRELDDILKQKREERDRARSVVSSTEKLLAEANTGKADLTKQLAQANRELEDSKTAYTTAMKEQAAKGAQLSEMGKALEEERAKAQQAAKLQQEIALAKENERKLNRALEKATQEQANLLTSQQTKDTKISDTLKALEAESAKAARADDLDQKLAAALAKQRETALALEKAQEERSSILNDQSASNTKLAEALKELEAERTKAARAAELEKELADLRAKASENQAALAKFQESSKATEAQITALTLAKIQTSEQAAKSQADLEQRLAARDAELVKLRTGLNEKENAWKQERVAFQTRQKEFQAEIATARRTQAVMQSDFLRIDLIRYELNSSQIDNEQARVLTQAQKILKVYPKASFEISGHTCTLGSDKRNQALSEQRAKRLLDFLASNGVDPGQLSAAGYGESQPIADNTTDAGRRKNRRVEIRVKSANGETLLDTEDRQ